MPTPSLKDKEDQDLQETKLPAKRVNIMATTTTTTTTTSRKSSLADIESDSIALEPVTTHGNFTASLMKIASAAAPITVVEAAQSLETLRPTNAPPSISKWQTFIIIATVACTTFLNSMLNGLLVVSLPTMAKDLNLAEELLLWPASVNSLACGCTLLVAGSIADVVGGRKVYLVGTVAVAATTVACGVVKTGLQLILFRATSGLAISLCIPSSVILITSNIPTGTARNTAFACLGAGNPVGFSIGLVLGGVFVDGIGWRWGYYIGGIVSAIVFVVCAIWVPSDSRANKQTWKSTIARLQSEIDWLGCFLISTSLGLYSYVLAVLASGVSHFLAPATLALFSIATVLVPAFIFYTRRQEKLNRKVIIPPSLWKNRVFTSLCLAVFFTWGSFTAVQFFLTLLYQEIQHLSAIQTSVRFLPMVFTGVFTNVIIGWLVKDVRADILVGVSNLISTISPLLLAFVNPSWSYWVCAFIATACMPICADALFTVANLVITNVFPPQTHGLAGGVFNTISNIGMSVGLAVTAVIASSVTLANAKGEAAVDHRQHVLEGYKATWWFCFAANVFVVLIVGYGMRKVGKVGIKME